MQITGIVIAKGAPNRCHDGRTVMCAIVISKELGLVRLYPITVTADAGMNIWSRVQCEAVKRGTDCRVESFRVESITILDRIESASVKSDLLNSCILRSGIEDPIQYQNNGRKSIAVVKSTGSVGVSLDPQNPSAVDHTVDVDDAWVMSQKEYPYKPFLLWTSMQGGEHKTHLCSQEVYEGIRHNASTPFRVFENLHIGDPDYEHWMILGNMKDRRNVWVCAHLHRQKKTGSITGTSLPMFGGQNENWPYSQQEEINARTVEPQKTFNFTT